MTPDEPAPAERLTAAMDVWLRHRQASDCSDEELLARHPSFRDLLEPLVADARGDDAEQQHTSSGRAFGSYRLLDEIGRGGVGVVYDAVQDPLGRHVALKLLSDSLQHHPQAVARFRREGGMLARLRHPHIVQVYDAGVEDGVPFHAMERIDGVSLQELLAQLAGHDATSCTGDSLAEAMIAAMAAKASEAPDRNDTAPNNPAPNNTTPNNPTPNTTDRNNTKRNNTNREDPDREDTGREHTRREQTIGAKLRARSHAEAAVRLCYSIADALATAHREGILHRDVKPANILLRRDGTAMLSDFGLARDIREPGLTQAGGFVGTPFYVSPEQAAGHAASVDVRSDLFSLAVVLYELLVLARPFEGETTEVVLAKVRQVDPHALLKTATALPADLLAVLERALQRRPEDRYDSMATFAGELAAILELRPVQARRQGWAQRAWQVVRRHPRQSATWTALTISIVVAASLWLHLANQQSRIDAGFAKEVLPQVEQHLDLAMLEAEGRSWDAAKMHVAAAAELLPELPLVLAAQAHVLWQSNDRQRARAFMVQLKGAAPEVGAQLERDAPEPTTSLGWFVRGWRQMQSAHTSGDMTEFQNAAKSYRRAIDRSPGPRRIFHCQYLHALSHCHDWEAVRAMVADVGHLWPDSPVVAYWRGFASIATNPTFAKQQLERACKELPDLAEPRLRLAKLLEGEGDLEGAEQHIRQILANFPHIHLPRLILARLLRSQQRARDALPILQKLQVDWPTNFRVPAERANTLVALGRYDEALAAAEEAVATAPNAPQVYANRAQVLLQLRRRQEALDDVNKACDMAPSNFDFLGVRARVFIHMARWQDAAENLRSVVALNPGAIGSWCDLAAMYRRIKDLDAAEHALQQAEALDPNHWLLHLQRAHVLQARKLPAEARKSFQLAADANPDHAEAVINLAGFHMSAREYDAGLDLLAEARHRQPELWQGWRPAIAILTHLKRHQQSEALLAAWCSQHAKDSTRWLQLATLRRKSPEHSAELAKAALDHAAALIGQDNPFVLLERGELLLQAGDESAARTVFTRLVNMKRVPAKIRKACQDHLAR